MSIVINMNAAHKAAQSQVATCEPRILSHHLAAFDAGRLIAAESERFTVERFGASALDPADSVRVFLTDETYELDLLVVVGCVHHFEGRDWLIEVKSVTRNGKPAKAPMALVARIESWLESERRGAAREVWGQL